MRKPVPEWWKPESSQSQRMDSWVAMTSDQRKALKFRHAKHEKFLAETRATVALQLARGETPTQRVMGFCERGVRDHISDEGRVAARAESQARTSAKNANQRLENGSPGCTVASCPLAVGTAPLFDLIERNHRDRSTKVGCVSLMNGAARQHEMEKVEDLCKYHHFQKTALQVGYRDRPVAPDDSSDSAQLITLKRRSGCWHPMHDQMPYASLLNLEADPTAVGFLDVSHVHRASGEKRKRTDEQRMDDLVGCVAEIHCRFCHALWTMLERWKTYDTAFGRDQSAKLQAAHPGFVSHFEDATAGYDWAAERTRYMNACSVAKKRQRTEAREAKQARAGVVHV